MVCPACNRARRVPASIRDSFVKGGVLISSLPKKTKGVRSGGDKGGGRRGLLILQIYARFCILSIG